MEPVDPLDLRISHTERDQVADTLREAAGDGRLDLDELEQRLEATYAARTYRDLVPITEDLPGTSGRPGTRTPVAPRDATPARQARPATPANAPAHRLSLAVMGETRRVGQWAVGSEHVATAVMGSVVLDLREAYLDPAGVVITANALMGSVEVVVDAATVVRVEGIGVMGSYGEARGEVAADTDAGSPVVRVRGLALMGSVEVRRKGPPHESLRGSRRPRLDR